MIIFVSPVNYEVRKSLVITFVQKKRNKQINKKKKIHKNKKKNNKRLRILIRYLKKKKISRLLV